MRARKSPQGARRARTRGTSRMLRRRPMRRAETIEQRLRVALGATEVIVEDESHRHAGHAGARSGGGHFFVTVVSDRFAGLDRVARHRAVYAALGDLMGGEIHALSADTLTPDEYRARADAARRPVS